MRVCYVMIIGIVECEFVFSILLLTFAIVNAFAPCRFLIVIKLAACFCNCNMVIANICASRGFFFVVFCKCMARRYVRALFFFSCTFVCGVTFENIFKFVADCA